jgi:mannose/cellobiose epimerase-like protein (N-acyl-D-glucosamine 2-epimerase family)
LNLQLPSGQLSTLRAVVRSVMCEVLRRSSRDLRYPWVDTKLDTIDGTELRSEGAVDLFGPSTVYAWIQGRAVEALAGHADWFRDEGDADLAITCVTLARRVAAALEASRIANGGRLWFWLDRSGVPFALDGCGSRVAVQLDGHRRSFSDLFHARGLGALALAEPGLAALADEQRQEILAAIRQGRFSSDQQPFDMRNRVGDVIGRQSFGAAMLAVGMCTLAARGSGGGAALADGLDLVEGILDRHANEAERWPAFPVDTMCEFIDDAGLPWLEDGHAISDPGHACELVGLALELCAVGRGRRLGDARLDQRMRRVIPRLGRVLAASFAIGFRGKGLCKHWSLSAGRPVHADLPWWALTETMRAAALLGALDPLCAQACGAGVILSTCTRCFLDGFINPAVHGWAVQTCDPDGRPVRRIPATPDADPGYHTGLCLIHVLRSQQVVAARQHA